MNAASVLHEPRAVPLDGVSDVVLRLPLRVQVRLAAESLLTGRSADAIAADAIAAALARDHAG